MPASPSASRLKPRCALRVGVVGNRRFAGEKDDTPPTPAGDTARAAVAAALGALWQMLTQSITDVLAEEHHIGRECVRMRELFSEETPRLAVLTALAAGTDQIGARTALAASTPAVEIQLEAVLPFSEKDYPGRKGATRREFRKEEADALRELAAEACQVIRLAGDYTDKESQQRSYRQATELLLHNSDLVVAVFDPKKAGGKAGTRETVDRALRRRTPVIALLVTQGSVRVAIKRTRDAEEETEIDWSGGKPLADAREEIERLIGERLLLGELTSRHASDAAQHALKRLKMMSGEASVSWLCRNRMPAAVFRRTWSTLTRLASLTVRRRQARHSPTPGMETILLTPYRAFYERASTLSEAFMRTYRGAFVLSYFLAGLAVAFAVVGLALLPFPEFPYRNRIAVVLSVSKIVIVCVLIGIEIWARWLRVQEAAVDFRYLAELLRPMQWLSPVGTYPQAVELPFHIGTDDPRQSWMTWLARAAARSSPCVSAGTREFGEEYPRRVTINAERVATALDCARDEWIAGQTRYHAQKCVSMETLEKGLERLTQVLLGLVLIAALGVLAAEEKWFPLDDPHELVVALAAFAAIFPAFIASLSGVVFQSEAKRLAKRSEAMYEQLKRKQEELERTAAALRAHKQPAPSLVRSDLERLAALTIAEAADWKVLYQVHEIHAG